MLTDQHVLQQYWHDDEEHDPQDVGDHGVLNHRGGAEEYRVSLELSDSHDDGLQQ